MVLSLNTSLSSSTYSQHRALTLLGRNSCHFIDTLFSMQLTPWLAKRSTDLFSFLWTWWKLTVRRSSRWIWTLWKTWINFQCLETLSGTVPLCIFCTELIINYESTSIMTLRQLSYFNKSRHCSIAITSTMLLVAIPRWQWKMKTILPSAVFRTPPYPLVPGFPFEAPSMLYYK